jgi:hypothetical protein
MLRRKAAVPGTCRLNGGPRRSSIAALPFVNEAVERWIGGLSSALEPVRFSQMCSRRTHNQRRGSLESASSAQVLRLLLRNLTPRSRRACEIKDM